MSLPYLLMTASKDVVTLEKGTSTVGRGPGVDIKIEHPSVSRLHAELVRRGPHLYVSDLGLSRNGTRVNGRPIGRRLLVNGDIISFGVAMARVGGIERAVLTESGAERDDQVAHAADLVQAGDVRFNAVRADDTMEMRAITAPDLTRREVEVLAALCRPLRQDDAFVAPASAREIATELVVTEAAVKQHLLRLYAKFRIPEGGERRTRLANVVVRAGLVRPEPRGPEPGDD